ncbi:YraN family protein [Campylobacter vulpis]|uniref:YraN family protein n=1 Tax=Campylobacter vulpis TaxID=1655500 RepID=UPI001BCE13AD|nr:YraN family protein [Campylobacter vulpis]MBS4235378.1 YraN family protein [Campylobacter vulpis]MBS4268701.1 YraN family protein [Campylobacter vulpis]
MGLASHLSGILGENRACAFLKKHRFEILERNFHSKFGEIDIIAKKDEILHFVEVKFTEKDYEPYERLDLKKYNKILKTIEFYKLKRQISNDFQLDLICIKGKEIEFFENISL